MRFLVFTAFVLLQLIDKIKLNEEVLRIYFSSTKLIIKEIEINGKEYKDNTLQKEDGGYYEYNNYIIHDNNPIEIEIKFNQAKNEKNWINIIVWFNGTLYVNPCIWKCSQTDCNASGFYLNKKDDECEVNLTKGMKCDSCTLPTVIIPDDKILLEQQQKLEEALLFKEYNINVYDSQDPFFNDMCVIFPLDNTTDMPRKDRVDKYLQDNSTLCNSSCIFKGTNPETLQPDCDCSKPPEKNDNLTFDGMKDNLIATLLDANFEVVLCYQLVFNSTLFPINIGSWVMIGIGVGILSNFVVFLCRNIKGLLQYLYTVYEKKVKKNEHRPLENHAQPLQNQDNKGLSSNLNTKQKKQSKTTKNTKNIDDHFHQPIPNKRSLRPPSNMSMINNQLVVIQQTSKDPILRTDEYDDMNYNEVIEHDKRNYCITYWSYLKAIHPILYPFVAHNPKILRTVKISRFFTNIMLDMSLSAFFYSDSYISNNLNNGGNDFIYNLPISLYTWAVSSVLNVGFGLLASSDTAISKIEKIEDPKLLLTTIKKFKICYMIRISFFFGIQLLLMVGLWYYVAAFCAVYQNSQVAWLISCGTSTGITMSIPFGTCLILAAFRRVGINYKSTWLLKTLAFFAWFF